MWFNQHTRRDDKRSGVNATLHGYVHYNPMKTKPQEGWNKSTNSWKVRCIIFMFCIVLCGKLNCDMRHCPNDRTDHTPAVVIYG